MHVNDNLKNFAVLEVPLEGSNLIEASAGTGKTYSIAILVLRLLLEKEFSLKEILMVTFTKAAVAELEERVRLFVRTAYQFSQGVPTKNETIKEIVQRAESSEGGAQRVERLLKAAITLLDETAVLTIHSFCQQTLSEFAFETNQPFGAELLVDSEAIIEAEVNKFWRKEITRLPVDVLNLLQINNHGLTRENLQKLVTNALAGKILFAFDPTTQYVLDAAFCQSVIEEPISLQNNFDTFYAKLKERVITEKESLAKCCNVAYAKNSLLPFLDDPGVFLEKALLARGKPYGQKALPDWLADLDSLQELKDQLANPGDQYLNHVYGAAIQHVTEQIKTHKAQHNQLAFDDLIDQLHQALEGPNRQQLITALRQKFKAVFIDEFQDTDRQQYDIFKTAFEAQTVVFYIGDPKQSIYAWRKADIDTYLKASKEVDAAYGMNINFRSSTSYIEAMNSWFLPRPDFDTFYFEGQQENAFSYRLVDAPKNSEKGSLTLNGQPCTPIAVHTTPNKESNTLGMAAQVAELLSNEGYKLGGGKGEGEQKAGRSIIPSDIGILVRSNKEAIEIKKALSAYGIPSIVIGDAKILESPEAKEIFYLLDAMLSLTRASISRALLCSFTGFDTTAIQQLSDSETVERFRKYNAQWERDGIYKVLFSFITDFDVQRRLLGETMENGERKLTNLYQLIELLYKNQTLKSLSPLELLDWLKRGMEKGAAGDEYEQRIESDEDSITIMTIHKSKGLQFNIVLSPSLDLRPSAEQNIAFYDFRTADRGYVVVKKSDVTPAQKRLYEQQSMQENRRLLYVTLTRAVYKCYIFRTTGRSKVDSSILKPFIDEQMRLKDPLVDLALTVDLPVNYRFEADKNKTADLKPAVPPVDFNLQDINWNRLSYTYLAAKPERLAKKLSTDANGDQQSYDHFVFRQMVRGNVTGNMLHYIFETIHFTKDERWSDIVTQAVQRFAPAASAIYIPMLLHLIKEVLGAKINTETSDFTLADLQPKHRLQELEFDFPVSEWLPKVLETAELFADTVRILGWQKLAGMMNGKIDMLFEHEGQYYVLDWKSTYLGDELSDYRPDRLEEAMTIHNYHLQYLIYTVAAKKYLESRLENFDYDRDFGGVLYFFLRGVRKNKPTGIYFVKPTKKQIDFLEDLFAGQQV